MVRSAYWACLAATVTSCAQRTVREPAVPSAALDVVRYEAALTLDVPNRSLSGKTTIVFGHALGVREVRFPIDDLVIEEVTSAAQRLAFRVEKNQLVVALATDTGPEIGV